MDKELIKYFKDGITIDKLQTGKYAIFTVKTQRFTIESFEQAITLLEERKKIQSEMIISRQKEIEQNKIEGISVKDLSFDYFKTISEQPKLTEITVGSGGTVKVGNKYLLRLNNGQEHEVYVHSVYKGNKTKSEDSSEIGLIIADTGKLSVFSISHLKKSLKEFTLISK